MTNRDTVQGMIALHCKLAQMDGCKLDKKAMRFSAMADYYDHGESCCVSPFKSLQYDVIFDAVETAIIGNAMHTGEPFNRSAYKWMEK